MESSLSVLIGRYVHKLNGLVGLIRAEVRVLQIGKADLLMQDDTLSSALEKIEDIAAQLLSLTDEFKLSFVSPQEGKFISVKTIVAQALQDTSIPDSIEVMFDSEDEIPDVHADNNLVEVFRNVFTNAIEAMPEGGRLQIVLKYNREKSTVETIVTDSGRGIPSYVADSLLFQPYFSTKGQKGHGLGLWWSKVYLERLGGSITMLSSEIGKGTSFLISLPISMI